MPDLQGLWNGALPPIGYRIVAAEQRGAKIKKRLEIDPLHADTVRLIYRLYLEGDGVSGPMGVKAITCHLNERRIFTRDGGRWGLAQIHTILTRTTYIGEHRFNTRSHKDGERKPESEVAVMDCPPLIDREIFDTVQARLKARDPRMVPARVTSGPTLLIGICFCAKCGGAMTLRTGKGSAGGIYRYYTCSTRARQGRTGCEGRSIPMNRLDQLVAKHLEERLLQPERLETILASVLDRRQERTERRREHLAELHKRITETDQRLNRLYDAIESGVSDLHAPGLKERIVGLKALREQASADAEHAQAAFESSGNQAFSLNMVRAFARTARQRIRLEGGGYRCDHLRALAQRVEVADREVRIIGSKSELLRTLVAASGGKSSVVGVQSSVLKWRTQHDSNVRPLPSEGWVRVLVHVKFPIYTGFHPESRGFSCPIQNPIGTPGMDSRRTRAVCTAFCPCFNSASDRFSLGVPFRLYSSPDRADQSRESLMCGVWCDEFFESIMSTLLRDRVRVQGLHQAFHRLSIPDSAT